MPAFETVSAVCDLLVDDSYKMAKFEKQNVLIALEFSIKSLSNGTFMHALNSLESTLESLGEDINIGICLFDSGVTFFDVDVDEETIGREIKYQINLKNYLKKMLKTISLISLWSKQSRT
jgi:hypothetical protein